MTSCGVQSENIDGIGLGVSNFRFIVYDDAQDVVVSKSVSFRMIRDAVMHLVHLAVCGSAEEAFATSLMGARVAERVYSYNRYVNGKREGIADAVDISYKLLSGFQVGADGEGHLLDDCSVVNACKLITFSSWFDDGDKSLWYGRYGLRYSDIVMDRGTVDGIKVMVERCIHFFGGYDFKEMRVFRFKDRVIGTDRLFFMTSDTLVVLQVSGVGVQENRASREQEVSGVLRTVEMFRHSNSAEFSGIHRICIFNPYLNKAWVCDGVK